MSFCLSIIRSETSESFTPRLCNDKMSRATHCPTTRKKYFERFDPLVTYVLWKPVRKCGELSAWGVWVNGRVTLPRSATPRQYLPGGRPDGERVLRMNEYHEPRSHPPGQPRGKTRLTTIGSMSKTRLWIIITDRRRPICEVLRELTDAGLVVGHVLEAIGGITGSAEEKAVENLRKVNGVMNIWPDSCLDVGSSTSSFSC
jgi:hypothetical protein